MPKNWELWFLGTIFALGLTALGFLIVLVLIKLFA